MDKKELVLKSLLGQGMLPLFYHNDPQVSLEIVRTLYRAGVRVLEFTNRGEAALNNFKFLKENLAEMPEMLLGIGTIKTAEQAQSFLSAGADFIVSPIVNPEVARLVQQA